MAHLLIVTASARTEGSVSRSLADEFRGGWEAAHPGSSVTVRDVASLPHIGEGYTIASKMPAAARTPDLTAELALSDVLVDELAAADTVLIATPMYNWGLPSSLKAWFDHVIRMDRTTDVDFLAGTQVVVLVTSAGRYSSGERVHLDFVRPHVAHLLAVLGADDVTFANAELTMALTDNPRFASMREQAQADYEATRELLAWHAAGRAAVAA